MVSLRVLSSGCLEISIYLDYSHLFEFIFVDFFDKLLSILLVMLCALILSTLPPLVLSGL